MWKNIFIIFFYFYTRICIRKTVILHIIKLLILKNIFMYLDVNTHKKIMPSTHNEQDFFKLEILNYIHSVF